AQDVDLTLLPSWHVLDAKEFVKGGQILVAFSYHGFQVQGKGLGGNFFHINAWLLQIVAYRDQVQADQDLLAFLGKDEVEEQLAIISVGGILHQANGAED